MTELYDQNSQPEASESSDIKFLDEDYLSNELFLNEKSNFLELLTPAAQSCLELYFTKNQPHSFLA